MSNQFKKITLKIDIYVTAKKNLKSRILNKCRF